MRNRIMLVVVGAMLCGAALPCRSALARSSGTNVYYHDQSGTIISAIAPLEARRLASSRLSFAVHLPTRWPAGAPLRTLWVMDRHQPRFVILYYGDGGGYITCQLRESTVANVATMKWVPETTTAVGGRPATMRRAAIGGPHPVIELLWQSHGLYYDLLGSTTTTRQTLMSMATSLP
jgi:hypothetical protein